MNINDEVRALNSISEIIESIVNYSVCCLPEDREEMVTEIIPQPNVSKKYFFILILELFSPVHSEYFPEKIDGDNLLTILLRILNNPSFGSTSECESLKNIVSDFTSWLETEFTYEIYSANIAKEIEIKLTRRTALYLIGNRCKHALPRSNAIVKKLTKIYKESGVTLKLDEEVQILEDIDTWLLDDFGGYHFTKLCELCSNIYHAIHEYIRTELQTRTIYHDDTRYSYDLPNGVSESSGAFEFYELFNRFRNPWVPKVTTSEYLQGKY